MVVCICFPVLYTTVEWLSQIQRLLFLTVIKKSPWRNLYCCSWKPQATLQGNFHVSPVRGLFQLWEHNVCLLWTFFRYIYVSPFRDSNGRRVIIYNISKLWNQISLILGNTSRFLWLASHLKKFKVSFLKLTWKQFMAGHQWPKADTLFSSHICFQLCC